MYTDDGGSKWGTGGRRRRRSRGHSISERTTAPTTIPLTVPLTLPSLTGTTFSDYNVYVAGT